MPLNHVISFGAHWQKYELVSSENFLTLYLFPLPFNFLVLNVSYHLERPHLANKYCYQYEHGRDFTEQKNLGTLNIWHSCSIGNSGYSIIVF
ncbi:hypothetical protein U14_02730 [Candidatus Moduliflexus flocculans]|uniref:Uncharacterized protein n=1 Tax=Candidatus Moduliflexus flocculans TaxID=1499966 RepID=A0A081BM70_9BACT|nr:hypothetical protein U14_02730 [Candidatus Moduliflexus flocculans]